MTAKIIHAFQAMNTPQALRQLADELEENGENHISVVVIIDGDPVDVRGLGTKTTVGTAYMMLDLAKRGLLTGEYGDG